jgi:tRNA G18 (ribose-2'-O)-methylase SpoU
MRPPKPGNIGLETNYEIRTHDSSLTLKQYKRLRKNRIYLILDNLRSAFNVGAIFRTADTARLAQIITCGYTAHPPHLKLEKTALGTTSIINTAHFKDVNEAVKSLKRKNIPVYALETTSKSRIYSKIRFPHALGMVLGNEALGIQKETLDLCDKIIEIPMYGYKNSMNVASACAVVVFEILRQWKRAGI